MTIQNNLIKGSDALKIQKTQQKSNFNSSPFNQPNKKTKNQNQFAVNHNSFRVKKFIEEILTPSTTSGKELLVKEKETPEETLVSLTLISPGIFKVGKRERKYWPISKSIHWHNPQDQVKTYYNELSSILVSRDAKRRIYEKIQNNFSPSEKLFLITFTFNTEEKELECSPYFYDQDLKPLTISRKDHSINCPTKKCSWNHKLQSIPLKEASFLSSKRIAKREICGAYDYLERFIKNLNQTYHINNWKYVIVAELQKRGAWHFHMLSTNIAQQMLPHENCNTNRNQTCKTCSFAINHVWKYGWVDYRPIQAEVKPTDLTSLGVTKYLTKYLVKTFTQLKTTPENRQKYGILPAQSLWKGFVKTFQYDENDKVIPSLTSYCINPIESRRVYINKDLNYKTSEKINWYDELLTQEIPTKNLTTIDRPSSTLVRIKLSKKLTENPNSKLSQALQKLFELSSDSILTTNSYFGKCFFSPKTNKCMKTTHDHTDVTNTLMFHLRTPEAREYYKNTILPLFHDNNLLEESLTYSQFEKKITENPHSPFAQTIFRSLNELAELKPSNLLLNSRSGLSLGTHAVENPITDSEHREMLINKRDLQVVYNEVYLYLIKKLLTDISKKEYIGLTAAEAAKRHGDEKVEAEPEVQKKQKTYASLSHETREFFKQIDEEDSPDIWMKDAKLEEQLTGKNLQKENPELYELTPTEKTSLKNRGTYAFNRFWRNYQAEGYLSRNRGKKPIADPLVIDAMNEAQKTDKDYQKRINRKDWMEEYSHMKDILEPFEYAPYNELTKQHEVFQQIKDEDWITWKMTVQIDKLAANLSAKKPLEIELRNRKQVISWVNDCEYNYWKNKLPHKSYKERWENYEHLRWACSIEQMKLNYPDYTNSKIYALLYIQNAVKYLILHREPSYSQEQCYRLLLKYNLYFSHSFPYNFGPPRERTGIRIKHAFNRFQGI